MRAGDLDRLVMMAGDLDRLVMMAGDLDRLVMMAAHVEGGCWAGAMLVSPVRCGLRSGFRALPPI